jgi:hypothetical protein
MILMYMLFALTVSTVLTALISAYIPKKREGEAFIGFFVALMVLAWAADEWLLPTLTAGQKTSWLPILILIMFGGFFVASTILSVKTYGSPQPAMVNHENRHNAEAMVFDLILWFALLIVGIAVLRSSGL